MLARTPLTARQLLKLSETFPFPFRTRYRVQVRLRELKNAGLLNAWRYATTDGSCGELYYKLTVESYRLIHGPDAQPPTKRFLSEVSLARQHHTRSLADFTVHTAVCAHRSGMQILDFSPENTLRISVCGRLLFPDQSFSLRLASDNCHIYRVELDNSTEPVNSNRLDSWEQKLRGYYQESRASSQRTKLLIVNTKNGSRLSHILRLAARLNPDPAYSMVYGVFLSEYLAEPDALFAPCFRDERNVRIPLLRAFAGFCETRLPTMQQGLVNCPVAC